MRSYGGFSDRRLVADPALGAEGNAVPPDSNREIVVVVELLEERAQSILVGSTSDAAISCWLPLSQIRVDMAQRGRTLRVTMPLWLAREKRLVAEAGEGQGSLF